jgi:ERCC4-type nuclease
MTIAVDTREQEPYTFLRGTTARVKLDSGDYSVVGCESRIAVERKSMADFYNTVIKNRRRFYAELQRLGRMDRAVVLVEANWRDLLDHAYAGGAAVTALEGTVHAIEIDFGVPVIWAGDRQAAARWTEGWLTEWVKNQQRKGPRP